jgi:hypothetical protein
VNVALFVEFRSDGSPVFLRESNIALELDGDRHRNLAQADLPAEDAGQGTGLTLVVQKLEDQAILTGCADQLETERGVGRGTQDSDLRAFHASSWGER